MRSLVFILSIVPYIILSGCGRVFERAPLTPAEFTTYFFGECVVSSDLRFLMINSVGGYAAYAQVRLEPNEVMKILGDLPRIPDYEPENDATAVEQANIRRRIADACGKHPEPAWLNFPFSKRLEKRVLIRGSDEWTYYWDSSSGTLFFTAIGETINVPGERPR